MVHVEALDVTALEIDDVLEMRKEGVELARLARAQPGMLGDRLRAGDLRRQVGRYPSGLFPLAGRDRDHPGVVRVGVLAIKPRPRSVQEAPELVGDPALV